MKLCSPWIAPGDTWNESEQTPDTGDVADPNREAHSSDAGNSVDTEHENHPSSASKPSNSDSAAQSLEPHVSDEKDTDSERAPSPLADVAHAGENADQAGKIETHH